MVLQTLLNHFQVDGVETVDTHTARTNCAVGGYTGMNGRGGFRVGSSVCMKG